LLETDTQSSTRLRLAGDTNSDEKSKARMKACGDLGCWRMTHWTIMFRALVPCALTLSPLRERFIPVPMKFDRIIPHQTTGNVYPKNWDFL